MHLDDLLRERGTTLTELADRIGLTIANPSILKTGNAKAIRLTTLAALCAELQCQPGDLFGSTRIVARHLRAAGHVPRTGNAEARFSRFSLDCSSGDIAARSAGNWRLATATISGSSMRDAADQESVLLAGVGAPR